MVGAWLFNKYIFDQVLDQEVPLLNLVLMSHATNFMQFHNGAALLIAHTHSEEHYLEDVYHEVFLTSPSICSMPVPPVYQRQGR